MSDTLLALKKNCPDGGFIDRFFECELKTEGDEQGLIEGYASKFGEKDRGNDIVIAGAFKKSIRGRTSNRIPMLYGHQQSALPIGVWTSLKEDAIGLKVVGRLDIQSEQGGQMFRILKAGAEMGISIGYRTSVWEYDEKAQVRKLIEVDLFEVSLVPIPMLDSARVTSVKREGAPEDEAAAALIRTLDERTQALRLKASLDAALAAFGR